MIEAVDDPIVTVEHLRKANFCIPGSKEWFSAHGLDWKEFIRNGLPASVMEAPGDALGFMVTKHARNPE